MIGTMRRTFGRRTISGAQGDTEGNATTEPVTFLFPPILNLTRKCLVQSYVWLWLGAESRISSVSRRAVEYDGESYAVEVITHLDGLNDSLD